MKTIDVSKIAAMLTSFIQSSFTKEGIVDAVIGVSGGVDSATSATLAVRALGPDHVYPILLPYGTLNDQGKKDAQLIIDFLKIPAGHVQVVDIQPMVDAAVSTLDASMGEGRKGNVMARMRMVVLYDVMKKMNALVVGTENKTEHLLGYYTKFGDEASDIEPLRSLYKTQVYELATYLHVPQPILEKAPTAGLWVGQTDEEEFGFSYSEADELLWLVEEEHLTKEQVLVKGYDAKKIERLWWWLERGRLKDRLPFILPSRI